MTVGAQIKMVVVVTALGLLSVGFGVMVWFVGNGL